jgi:hypothetical protein
MIFVAVVSGEEITKEDMDKFVKHESTLEKKFNEGEMVNIEGDLIIQKDGVIYGLGKVEAREREELEAKYRARMAKRAEQVQDEIDRDHELKIERIKAQAMLDYLLAEAMVYGNNVVGYEEGGGDQIMYGGDSYSDAYASGGAVGDISVNAKGGKGGSSSSISTSKHNIENNNSATGGNATANNRNNIRNNIQNRLENRNDIRNRNKNKSTNNNTNNNSNSNRNNNNLNNNNTSTNNNSITGSNQGGDDDKGYRRRRKRRKKDCDRPKRRKKKCDRKKRPPKRDGCGRGRLRVKEATK